MKPKQLADEIAHVRFLLSELGKDMAPNNEDQHQLSVLQDIRDQVALMMSKVAATEVIAKAAKTNPVPKGR